MFKVTPQIFLYCVYQMLIYIYKHNDNILSKIWLNTHILTHNIAELVGKPSINSSFWIPVVQFVSKHLAVSSLLTKGQVLQCAQHSHVLIALVMKPLCCFSMDCYYKRDVSTQWSLPIIAPCHADVGNSVCWLVISPLWFRPKYQQLLYGLEGYADIHASQKM